MSEAMTQEDAMKMDNRQAAELLKPLRDMMIDQNGCPVSSAVFALDKAIEALTADVRENVRGEWIKPISRGDVLSYGRAYYECDRCHKVAFFGNEMNFCPNCGAEMGGNNHD